MVKKYSYILVVFTALFLTACSTGSAKQEGLAIEPGPAVDDSLPRPAGPARQEPESDSVPDLIATYKTLGDLELSAHIFYPEAQGAEDETAVLVFMHGGALRRGSPLQGYAFADRFTAEGVAVVAVQYRLLDGSGTDSGTMLNNIIADAKSSVRWLRENADTLGLDADRILMMGHSAGAYLALTTAVLPGFDEPSENSNISSVPNALVPWSSFPSRRDDPDNSMVPEGMSIEEMSPSNYVRGALPPALFIHGSEDPIASPEAAVAFEQQYRAAGNQSSFEMIEGADHFFRGAGQRAQVMNLISRFLAELGYSS